MFVHRVGAAKLSPGSDDPKPITHVTVPSCYYFHTNGWNEEVINGSHFQPRPFAPPNLGASAGGEGARLATSPCEFSMHSLYDASLSCGGYDFSTANGTTPLPVFKVGRLTGGMRWLCLHVLAPGRPFSPCSAPLRHRPPALRRADCRGRACGASVSGLRRRIPPAAPGQEGGRQGQPAV